MKNFEKFEILLNAGYFVPLQDNKDYIIVCPFRGNEGYWASSYWESSIEDCRNFLGACDFETKSLREKEFKILHDQIFRLESKPLPIGTKVRLREDWEEIAEEVYATDNFIFTGGISKGEIYEVLATSKNEIKTLGGWLPLECVIPVFEDELVLNITASTNPLKKYEVHELVREIERRIN